MPEPALRGQQFSLYLAVPPSSPRPSYVRMRTTVKHHVAGTVKRTKRREECERKARRGEMDPRLEFAFQLLIDGTQLPRSDLMDYVFEGNMVSEAWFKITGQNIDGTQLPRSDLMDYVFEGKHGINGNTFSCKVCRAEPVYDWSNGDKMDDNIHSRLSALQVKPSTSRGTQAVVPKIQAVPVGPPKKKLFLTDGWQVPLTGICIYMFRLNTGKQLPEEGFHKDLYCGIIDAANVGLVTSIERIMEHVFMEALAHPAPDAEEDDANNPTVKNQLLPGLRSFCSALKVCEEVCDEPNLFEDGLGFMANIHTLDEVRELVKQPERLTGLEERVKAWIRKVQEVIMESQQLRKENDSSGPQDELEYWKKRGAQFSQIVSHLQCHENPPLAVTLVSPPQVQMTLQCLHVARSKMIKHWRDTDRHITFCYNESRDNAKFIQSMEKCCHSLYLHDPVSYLVRIKDSIMGLLQTVRLIHSVSQYYNTSERTSSLMVKSIPFISLSVKRVYFISISVKRVDRRYPCPIKESTVDPLVRQKRKPSITLSQITNQMIDTCKQYVTCRGKETIWSQDRDEVRIKLVHCIKLNETYRRTYVLVKGQAFLPGQTSFGFSENYVFGKFDTFCDRLSKIIGMFDLVDDYNTLFQRRMEGGHGLGASIVLLPSKESVATRPS
uniref:Dynein heavy chain tail domain-containing protein n=1 Tax=Timema cristinae TaxID=61476 RepID=A0A7R9CKH5_TIMCR|nr:unnamed protein product [Timema cristinae]